MSNSNQLSHLWDESRRGNVEAFGAIHHELYPALLNYLLKIFKDEDISQDILQDLFVKFWERKETLGPIHNIKVYFFKAARSMAFNYLKSRKNQTLPLSDSMDIDLVFSQEDIQVTRESNLEVNRLLSVALNALPKRQKEMIFLKYFEEWNYAEIADVTGIKYQSVINLVHRGMLQLRSELADDRYFQRCRQAV